MKDVGRLADFASILIPGETWVKIGGKILHGTKVVAESGKIIKQADAAADVIRGLYMLKKNNMKAQNGVMNLDAEKRIFLRLIVGNWRGESLHRNKYVW